MERREQLTPELTRRTLLTAAGAAALAAALPRCGSPRDAIQGAIVGGNASRGHLLRDGLPDVAAAEPERVPVVIAGGGVAGLSAAWKLARSGFDDFVLLELEDALGGTSIHGESSVSAYPWAAHYLPVPTREQRAVCELLSEMDVISGFDAVGRAVPRERHVCRAPQERTFVDGVWAPGLLSREGRTGEQLTRFLAAMDAFAARRDPAGRRAFAIPIAHSSRDPELLALDQISMARWLDDNGYDDPGLRWYVEYACRDDFGCLLADTSAWAGIHYFAARIPAEGEESSEFLTWPEGNGFLVTHLASVAADRVRTGAVVARIEPLGGSLREPQGDGARVRWIDASGGAPRHREIVADRVISAMPRFVTRRVVQGLPDDGVAFGTTPWVIANITLRRAPLERAFPLAWDNVLPDSDSLGYVVATHQSDRPGPRSVWTWYRPFCGPDVAAERTRLSTLTWSEFRDMVLADLLPAHPDIEPLIERIDVWIWGHAMVRPEPGSLWSGAREAAATPHGAVHFAAADLGGLPLFEEAQWAGVRAAEEVLEALGRPYESSL